MLVINWIRGRTDLPTGSKREQSHYTWPCSWGARHPGQMPYTGLFASEGGTEWASLDTGLQRSLIQPDVDFLDNAVYHRDSPSYRHHQEPPGLIMAKKKQKRDPKVVERFLKKEGLTKVPKGKEVDHKVPLVDGGSDTVRNLQLLTEKQHAAKTSREATERAKKK